MSGKTVIFGLILILLGLIFFGQTTGMYLFSFDLILPIVLIAVGVWLIIRKKKQIEMERMQAATGDITSHPKPSSATPPRTPPPDMDDLAKQQASQGFTATAYQAPPKIAQSPSPGLGSGLKYSKTFGDMYIDCNGVSLENIEVSSFLGDIEIKLNEGILSRGLNRIVISGFVGDVRVYLPKGMAFFTQCSNFIGDIELDDRRTSGFSNNVELRSDNYESAESKLYIAANSFLGDIRFRVV